MLGNSWPNATIAGRRHLTVARFPFGMRREGEWGRKAGEPLTLQGLRSILGRMIADRAYDSEKRLDTLENRVTELLRACDQLNAENRSLRERQDALVAERAVLIEKNELARTRVEAMINRLKAMEQG